MSAQALKVLIAHEILKLFPSASLPPCLPDLRVITALDLKGSNKWELNNS